MESSEIIKLVEVQESQQRLEAEKAWETSWTRRFFTGFLMYIVGVLFFALVGIPRPVLSALILFTGYVIASLVLAFIKRGFIKRWANTH